MMLNARFSALAVLCCLATQSFGPTAVNAAVIPGDKASASKHHHHDGGSTGHTQSYFPWKGDSLPSIKHKVRTTDFYPANPFQRAIVDAIISRTQRARGLGRPARPHKSIIIPNGRGRDYVLPHGRRSGSPAQWSTVTPPQNGTVTNSTASAADDSNGSPSALQGEAGTIAIVSPPNSKIASLVLECKDKCIFDASEKNSTQVALMDAPSSASSIASSGGKPVMITTMAEGKMMCATFDPNPDSPAPMTAESCDQASAAGTGSQAAHKSQLFMYDEQSGNIRPMSYTASENGDKAAVADVPSSSVPSSPSQNATSSFGAADSMSTATSFSSSASATPSASSIPLSPRASAPAESHSQNVTLVFIPNSRKPAKVAAAAAIIQSDSESTATVTRTVTVFESTRTSSSTIYAASVTSSAPANASTSPTASATELDVELVGGGLSTSSGAIASSTSSFAAASATDSSVVYTSSFASGSASSSFAAASATDSVASSFVSGSASSSFAAASVTDSVGYTSSFASGSATSSFAAASVTDSPASVSSSPTVSTSSVPPASSSVDAAGIAASIAIGHAQSSASRSSSASASSSSLAAAAAPESSSSPSPSPSTSASVSSSISLGAAAETSSTTDSSYPSSTPTFVAAVEERDALQMTPVSTEPYSWMFKSEPESR